MGWKLRHVPYASPLPVLAKLTPGEHAYVWVGRHVPYASPLPVLQSLRQVGMLVCGRGGGRPCMYWTRWGMSVCVWGGGRANPRLIAAPPRPPFLPAPPLPGPHLIELNTAVAEMYSRGGLQVLSFMEGMPTQLTR